MVAVWKSNAAAQKQLRVHSNASDKLVNSLAGAKSKPCAYQQPYLSSIVGLQSANFFLLGSKTWVYFKSFEQIETVNDLSILIKDCSTPVSTAGPVRKRAYPWQLTSPHPAQLFLRRLLPLRNPLPIMRILCLHGKGTSAAIFRSQTCKPTPHPIDNGVVLILPQQPHSGRSWPTKTLNSIL